PYRADPAERGDGISPRRHRPEGTEARAAAHRSRRRGFRAEPLAGRLPRTSARPHRGQAARAAHRAQTGGTQIERRRTVGATEQKSRLDEGEEGCLTSPAKNGVRRDVPSGPERSPSVW